MRIDPSALAGRRLTSVATSWHEFEGVRHHEPIHIWLRLDALGSVRLHTLNGLILDEGEPDETMDMAEHGRAVVVSGGPAPIAEKVGQTVQSVQFLEQFHDGRSIGMVGVRLEFETGSVGLADAGDTLVVEPWPGRWAAWNVTLVG